MRKVKVKIPAGVDNGVRLRLRGEGEAGKRGGPPGDLYVHIRVRPDPVFRREGDNLLYEAAISFPQAALGAEIEVPTLESTARVKVPEGTQSGSTIRLKGKGVPNPYGHSRGDLIVRLKVVTPTRLTERQKELLREFARLSGEEITKGEKEKGFFEKVRDAFM